MLLVVSRLSLVVCFLLLEFRLNAVITPYNALGSNKVQQTKVPLSKGDLGGSTMFPIVEKTAVCNGKSLELVALR